jgi:hypothetical protein
MGLIIGIGIGVTFDTGGGPARWASYPAPPGYRWDFVTSSGSIVTFNDIPVVALVGV